MKIIFLLNIKITIFLQLILLKEYLNSDSTKIIIKENDNCGDYYEFGDYCYENCESQINLKKDENSFPIKCMCDGIGGKSFINVTKINDLNYYRCVDSCYFGYYNIENNICVDKCKAPYDKIKLNKGGTGLHGCIEECLNSEFLYNDKENNYFCLNKCPNEAKFIDGNKCVEKCPDDKFFYTKTEFGYECSEDCYDNNKPIQAYIDIDSGTFLCNGKDRNSACTDDSFPYAFEGSCFKNCEDTKHLKFFGNKTTFFLTYGNNKICSEECKETFDNNGNIKKFYKVPNSSYCVDDCKKTDFKFHLGSNCLSNCTEINNINRFHYYDTGECDSGCNNNYHLLREEETCYKDPPIHSGKIYLDNSGEWNTCENGEGYHINQNNDYNCLSSCDLFKVQITETIEVGDEPQTTILKTINYYHKYNNNICLNKDSNDSIFGKAFKYKSGNDYILYSSCADMPDKSYKYAYLYKPDNDENNESIFYKYECRDRKELNDICYNVSGMFYCLEVTYSTTDLDKAQFCSEASLYYLRNNECINDCTGEYKILFEKTQTGVIKKLGQCLNFCPNDYPYYSKKDKICYKECSKKTLKENIEYSIPTTPIGEIFPQIYSEGNCLDKCTEDYPYEFTDSENKVFCLKNCPTDFYYYKLNNITKKCVDDCSKISKYTYGDECVDKCKKTENGKPIYKYYYIDENKKKICVDSCKENQNDYKYSLLAENDHQECLNKCPENYKFYYDDKKICLSKCENGFFDIDDIEKENIKCLTSCNGNNKHIINENICSNNCTNEEPFSIKKLDGIVKCTSNCKNEDENYKYYSINSSGEKYECLIHCDYLFFGNQCLKKCPNGLYEESNNCTTKCNKPYFEKLEDGENNNNYYYKCKDNCGGKYIASTGECVEKCPLGENFIGEQNRCKNSCGGSFYREKKDQNIQSVQSDQNEENEETINYKIYECIPNCNSNEFLIEGSKECNETCPESLYESPSGICYKICKKDSIYSFSETEAGKRICSTGCNPNSNNKYYGEDRICVDKCSGSNYIINYNNSCVNKCDNNTEYKYLVTETSTNEGNEIKTYYCKNTCDKKYSLSDYICVEKCEKPNNFVINNKICSEKCEENQYAVYDNTTKEYYCKDKCDSDTPFIYYYKEEKICIDKCDDGHYIIENTNECISSCNKINNSNTYYFYEPTDSSPYKCVQRCPKEKPFIVFNHCKENCTQFGYQYYLESEKECLDKCPPDYVKNGFQCIKNCKLSNNTFLDENGNCIESCANSIVGNNYYYESDKKCIKKCNESDFIDNNKCVSSCPDTNKFIYNKKCVENCLPDKNYYIGMFEHGEIDLNIFCLTDCPKDYPFFENDSNKSHKCSGSCSSFYITNDDPFVISKECVEKCENEYKFYVVHNKTHKECLKECTKEKKYYYKSDSINICVERCPPEHPYHESNSFECIDHCNTNYAYYNVTIENKECVPGCERGDFWYKDSNESIICVKNCFDVENKGFRFSTPENECVISCNETKNLRGRNGFCECNSFFYYNENGNLVCFEGSTNKCGEEGKDSQNYTIQINGTKQCIQNC